jgi:hypothetical protein
MTAKRAEMMLKRTIAEFGGNGRQSGMATHFPRNPPPAGLAYSRNFSRAQKDRQFATQTRG